MRFAIAEAEKAAAFSEVPVGAAVFDASGQLIAKAANDIERACDPCGHAELIAIRRACKRAGSPRLGGHILVVTLEPCLMCAGAIALSRLDGVVFGAYDTRAGALSSIADRPNLPLAGRVFWHLGGIEAERCGRLLGDFFARKRPGISHV